jgi:hypothetical protein
MRPAVNRPLVKDVRKAIPLSIKLAVALRMLGFVKGQRVDFDHDPALACEIGTKRNRISFLHNSMPISSSSGRSRTTTYD